MPVKKQVTETKLSKVAKSESVFPGGCTYWTRDSTKLSVVEIENKQMI